MPSTYMTRCTSSTTSGMGQTSQNLRILRLNVLPPPGMSHCLARDSSQPRKAASPLASVLYECTSDAPHDLQRHLCVPAFVLPLRFISPPQEGHFLLFMGTPV